MTEAPMAQTPGQPDNVSSLIDRLLREKDPAAVGLRRILKSKQEQGADYPCKTLSFDEFQSNERPRKLFTDAEKRLLELEKKVSELTRRLEQAAAERDRAVAASFDKGLAQGRREGEAAGLQKSAADCAKKVIDIQQKTGQALRQFEQARGRLFSEAEHAVLRLATLLAGKILNREIAADEQAVLPVIKKTLGYIADRDRIVVRIAAEDWDVVNREKDFWAPVADGLEKIMIERDERIERGGCIIESNSGVADARLGVQLAELSELIEKTWHAASASPRSP